MSRVEERSPCRCSEPTCGPCSATAAIAERPCRDCPPVFAAEMRAEGRCNGTPGWHPPADDHEEPA